MGTEIEVRGVELTIRIRYSIGLVAVHLKDASVRPTFNINIIMGSVCSCYIDVNEYIRKSKWQ